MTKSNQSAYRLAPWRKQMNRIIAVLIVTIIMAAVIMIYLNISEKMTDKKLNIQILQEERADYSRQIADLTTDEGRLTAYKKMQERAQAAGYVDIDFYDPDQYSYVVIDGYTGTGINTEEKIPEQNETEIISLVKPEDTESLQEWLYKRISTGIESYEITN